MPSRPFVVVTTFGPCSFEVTEDDPIETLVDMCRMRWVTEDVDLVGTSVFQQLKRVVGIVTVDQEKPWSTSSLLPGLSIKAFDPFDPDLTINVALLGVTETSSEVSDDLSYVRKTPTKI
jgi:hypothetical protein